MVRNYLLSIWRNFQRNRLFTLLNVAGLAIGMAACLLIAQFATHELSYDNFWGNGDRIYRLQLDRYNKGELTTRWAAGAMGIGPDLKANFPEVERYVRIGSSTALLSSDGETYFKEPGVYYASQDFFRVMGYPLLQGIDSSALKEPNRIVLSRSLARKYFGEGDPMGKTIMNKKAQYVVSGVFEDLPTNTHMKIDALQSFATFARLIGRHDESELTSWQWDGFHTYILLRSGARAADLEAKLPEYVQRREGESMKEDNAGMVFHLQKVSTIHLDSNFMHEFKANGNRETVYFLLIVAALILLIAWINYVNLATAKSVERAREVGVRKVMGGFRFQLMQQFLIESVLLNLVAIGLAVLAAALLTPWFSELSGRELGYSLFSSPLFWTVVAGLVVGGALLSGLYPALILSSYKPVEVLKGRFKSTGQGVYFRKAMVLIQFVASVTLLAGTFTVYRQLEFLRAQELGVNIDKTLVLWSPNNIDSTYKNKYEVFKERIKQYAEVSSVCASNTVPGRGESFNAGGIRRLSQRPDESNQYRIVVMDEGFIPAYGLQTIAGRPFKAGDKASVILTEAALRVMGFQKPEDAIDDQIYFWGDTLRIVGVVKNYRQESAKRDYDHLIFVYSPSPEGFYSIKFNTAQVMNSMDAFEADWKQLFPGNPFNYFFLDQVYDNQYKADRQFGQVFGVFAGLAIFIACLGLFGLSSLTTIQRTKEIGIRKVLGSSVSGILVLISKDYARLMILAVLVATPLSWWIMKNWLADFATRIPLSLMLFAIPSLVVFLTAGLTVAFHTLGAATTDPVKSLRYE